MKVTLLVENTLLTIFPVLGLYTTDLGAMSEGRSISARDNNVMLLSLKFLTVKFSLFSQLMNTLKIYSLALLLIYSLELLFPL